MARVNIEAKLFSDPRWMKLLLKVGCRHKALGLITGAWMLAQKNWLQYQCVPDKAWDSDFEILIEIEFAARRADGSVYVKGSKKAFGWLEQRTKAGRMGGLKKAQNSLAVASGRLAGASKTYLPIPIPIPSLTHKESITYAKRSELTAPVEHSSPVAVSKFAKNTGPIKPDLKTLWNENCGELPKMETFTPSREKLWNIRWRTKPELDYWVSVIKRIAASPFCCGLTESGTWRANVDWFLKPSTATKVLEGFYDGKPQKKKLPVLNFG